MAVPDKNTFFFFFKSKDYTLNYNPEKKKYNYIILFTSRISFLSFFSSFFFFVGGGGGIPK